jgi:hypothetical protein
MILLDTLVIHYGSEERSIELYQGDLTDLRPEEGVDILVVRRPKADVFLLDVSRNCRGELGYPIQTPALL